jgi:hypothetical protein
MPSGNQKIEHGNGRHEFRTCSVTIALAGSPDLKTKKKNTRFLTGHTQKTHGVPFFKLGSTLVEHFKFSGEKIGEKCPFFFTHFSLKK